MPAEDPVEDQRRNRRLRWGTLGYAVVLELFALMFWLIGQELTAVLTVGGATGVFGVVALALQDGTLLPRNRHLAGQEVKVIRCLLALTAAATLLAMTGCSGQHVTDPILAGCSVGVSLACGIAMLVMLVRS